MTTSDSSSKNAAARVRLSRRVSNALKLIDDDLTLELVSAGEMIIGPQEDAAYRGDFIVGILNLQVRLILLVGRGSDALSDDTILEDVRHTLWSNPETSACLLVADDDSLTSRVYEVSDVSSRTSQSAAKGRASEAAPVAEALRMFLRQVVPNWPAVESVQGEQLASLNYDDEIRTYAANARRHRSEAGARIPERRRAREDLSELDDDWAVKTVKSILQGTVVDVDRYLGREVK